MKRNDDFIAELNAREKNLWEIIGDQRPAVFSTPRWNRHRHGCTHSGPASFCDESTIDIGAYTDDILRYLDLKIEIDDRVEERERKKQKIIQAMENSRYGVTPYHRITVADGGRMFVKNIA